MSLSQVSRKLPLSDTLATSLHSLIQTARRAGLSAEDVRQTIVLATETYHVLPESLDPAFVAMVETAVAEGRDTDSVLEDIKSRVLSLDLDAIR